ncbi:MAG: T9SS type A sorting domain-containing protein, partial [Candidatus Neomarinimicrobiota bacterium]
NADGSFQNIMDGETWLEAWQGVESDQCGTPVAPHDGSNAATWEYNDASGELTLTGLGAYLGLPKAVNAGQLPDVEVPESVTYSITQEDGFMTVAIECGTGLFWTYKLVPAQAAMISINNSWMNDDFRTLVEMRPRDGGPWDWSGYDSISFKYNNTVAQSLENRVHLRLNLSDYADIADPSNYSGLGEYYYSFQYILDSEPGWNTVTLPLVRNDDWGGGGFNLTGWAGETGNGELDKHAIGGFHFEFSVSGGGDGDFVTGTVVLDDFKLTGSLNQLTNPGFELEDAQDDSMGWGFAIGGGHAEVVTDAAMAHSGEKYLSIGVTDNWAVAYNEDIVPAQFGETWRFSGYGKEVIGDGANGAALKLEAKDESGTILGTTGDVYVPLTSDYEHHHVEMVMPEGTVSVTAVIVASRWDGVEVSYSFDDMFLMSMGILDVVPPVAVGGISAVPASYYNLVTWTDIEGEEGESYHVYASTSPITDINDPAVDVVATNVLEGAQAAVHYLFHPLEDTQVTYYYAVACKDASNNVGEAGASESSLSNTAKGVPTISLNPPTEFAADGDLSEWYDSGIQPFMIGASDNSYGTPNVGMGAVDDDNDLHGTFYVAVDNDYLYIAAEVLDNVVVDDQASGWWTSDVVQICIGLYDQRGPKHVGMQRGEEPDYKMYFLPNGAFSDNGAGLLAENGDGNYFHETYNPDYAFEFRISLDEILIEDDVRLTPANGMRTPFEPMIHDNDGDGWEGQLVLSPTNDDMAHQTCEVWSSTWIGTQSTVLSAEEEIVANEFALHQNYPNPFNPETTIKFSIPSTQDVNLSVYNMLGQRVVTLFNGELQGGSHIAKWHAGDIASGVYIYKLTSSNKTITQKMLLLK